MRQPLMTQSTAISLKGRPTDAASGGSAGVSGDDRRSVAVSAAGAIAYLLFLFSWLVPVLSVLMYFRGRFAQEQANRSQQLDQCKRVATRRKNWVGFLRRCVHGNEQQGTFNQHIYTSLFSIMLSIRESCLQWRRWTSKTRLLKLMT